MRATQVQGQNPIQRNEITNQGQSRNQRRPTRKRKGHVPDLGHSQNRTHDLLVKDLVPTLAVFQHYRRYEGLPT
jgi:hypothetical protein